MRTMEIELSSNLTLNQQDLNRTISVNCTSASNLTLPQPAEGQWVEIVNAGTEAITLKDSSASTVATLYSGDRVRIATATNSSGEPVHESKAIVTSRETGGLVTQDRVVIDRAGAGIVLRSADQSLFEVRVKNDGTLQVIDLGTSDTGEARDEGVSSDGSSGSGGTG